MATLLHQRPRTRNSYVTLDEERMVQFALCVGSPGMSPEFLGRLARDKFVDLKIPNGVRERTTQELIWLVGDIDDRLNRKKIPHRETVVLRIKNEKRLEELTAVGVTVFDRNGLHFEWEPLIKDWPTLLDFGLALLIDPNRPFGDRLYRCQWSECLGFFLSIPSKKQGSFRWRYCCEEHYKDADREKVAERVRRHRANQARMKK